MATLAESLQPNSDTAGRDPFNPLGPLADLLSAAYAKSQASAAAANQGAFDLAWGGSPNTQQDSPPSQNSLDAQNVFLKALSGMGVGENSQQWQMPGATISADYVAPPNRLPPAPNGPIFGPPQDNPPGFDSWLSDQTMTQVGAPQSTQPQQQSGGILDTLKGLIGSGSATLDKLSAPRIVNGVPQPSYLDTAMAAAIGLGTGGGLSSFSGLNTLQSIQAINDTSTAQQLQRNQQIVDDNSPAGQMRKTQRKIYTSRMAGDVNQYIDMIGKDVNHTIPDQERDRLWNQLKSKYAPLGIDPGPSPSQVQQWNSESSSPEFRNAKLAESFRTEFGDAAGNTATMLLQSGAHPDKLMDYHVRLEKNRVDEKKLLIDAMKADHEISAKQIEDFRKRDLESFKETGIIGKQVTQQNGSKLLSTTPSYLEGQAAINSFHDSQLAALRGGTLASPTQFFGSHFPKDLTGKNFDSFVAQMKQGGQNPNSPAVHGDMYTVPATAATPDSISQLGPAEKARAIDSGSPAAKVMRIPPGKAVLMRQGNQLGWAVAKPGI